MHAVLYELALPLARLRIVLAWFSMVRGVHGGGMLLLLYAETGQRSSYGNTI